MGFFALCALAAPCMMHAQQAKSGPLLAVASAAFSPSQPAQYQGGTNRAPNGDTIGVSQRYLTRDGKPWIPIMGELHFTRLPESQWEDAILKMKASGVTVISTYVFWIHHEEIEDQWDWSGRRDLRHFAELCARHGMLLWVRVGPWDHGEVRNGGLPDWVLRKSPTRQLNPIFLAETRALYDQIGMQLKGLLWKNGGPVIGIQLENEYAQRGPGKGAAYILALKKLALQSGLDVPLYSVTGWDNAVVPPGPVLPVYGGYPDAPWGDSRGILPPQEVYVFRFGSRVTGNMGMIGNKGPEPGATDSASTALPFLTAEMGGGIQSTYHRRPVVNADDIASMMPSMIGSGVNGYGTYMFHGGINPDGKLTTLQESQATGYPTDVPEKDYDFQALIGAFGRERQSLRLEKEWNYFLADFGSTLAPMPAFAPDILPTSPADQSVLRWSVRTDGQSGFVFVNNYVRQHPMPAFPHVQFAIDLPGNKRVRLPREPITIPSGAFFAWPFHLDMDGVQLEYGTAQLLAKLPAGNPSAETYVFFCTPGVRCELAFSPNDTVHSSPGFRIRRTDAETLVTVAADAAVPFPSFSVQGQSGGHQVDLVVLSSQQALDTWQLVHAGRERMLQTDADVSAGSQKVTMQQLDNPHFRFSVYPAENSTGADGAIHSAGEGTYTANLQPIHVGVSLEQEHAVGPSPETRLGPTLPWRKVGVAEAPDDTVWQSAAARWSLHFKPSRIPAGVSNLFLKVQYAGDEARLESGTKLLDDNFFDGRTWMVGLDRFSPGGVLPPMQLEVLPLRADAPIYLPEAARRQIGPTGQTDKLDSVEVLPLYRISY